MTWTRFRSRFHLWWTHVLRHMNMLLVLVKTVYLLIIILFKSLKWCGKVSLFPPDRNAASNALWVKACDTFLTPKPALIFIDLQCSSSWKIKKKKPSNCQHFQHPHWRIEPWPRRGEKDWKERARGFAVKAWCTSTRSELPAANYFRNSPGGVGGALFQFRSEIKQIWFCALYRL